MHTGVSQKVTGLTYKGKSKSDGTFQKSTFIINMQKRN